MTDLPDEIDEKHDSQVIALLYAIGTGASVASAGALYLHPSVAFILGAMTLLSAFAYDLVGRSSRFDPDADPLAGDD